MKRGPKPQGEYTGKSAVFSTRITPALKHELRMSAQRSGRSLSQEIEARLWHSLENVHAVQIKRLVVAE